MAEPGAALIAAERQRQISDEGWTPKHDAGHVSGELVRAAITYSMHACPAAAGEYPGPSHHCADWWPWDLPSFRPGDGSVRALVKAGALIAAEIDRLLAAEGPVNAR